MFTTGFSVHGCLGGKYAGVFTIWLLLRQCRLLPRLLVVCYAVVELLCTIFPFTPLLFCARDLV